MSDGFTLGGTERGRDYQPLHPDGNLDDEAYGCHRRGFESFNVRNPRPDWQYYYVRRDTNSILRARYQGWHIIGPDDPERMGTEGLEAFRNAGLDGHQTGGDVVMAGMPMEAYRKFRAGIDAESERRRTDSAPEYTGSDRALSLQERYGRPIHFKAADHSVQRY